MALGGREAEAIPKWAAFFLDGMGGGQMWREKWPSGSSLEDSLFQKVMGDTQEPPFGSHFLQSA